MRIPQLLLAVTALLLPGAALAQRSPVLVELFTSQGCSACPPADAMLGELAKKPDVIALALHVDYWDYLGWKDSFGHEAHSRRQHAYAKAAGKRSVYTPQMIVQGADRLIGSDAAAVAAAVAAHQALPAQAELALERDGPRLTISLAPAGIAVVGPAEVILVRFLDGETVSIKHGENAGQAIAYHNIVTAWTPVGRWDGKGAAEIAVDLVGPESAAVVVQRERLGPVVTAAMLP